MIYPKTFLGDIMSVETDSSFGANLSAFSVVSLGAITTVASSMALLNTKAPLKMAQLAAASFLGLALTTSGATAWLDSSTRNNKTYWKNFVAHTCVGVPAIAALVAHSLFNAVISGVSSAIHIRVYEALTLRNE